MGKLIRNSDLSDSNENIKKKKRRKDLEEIKRQSLAAKRNEVSFFKCLNIV